MPQLSKLADAMNEIQWLDRLSPYNHSVDFPHLMTGTFSLHMTLTTVIHYLPTGIVDTFPIRVWKPKDKALRKALFASKYGTTVYKVQLSISLLGQIVLCTGPHLPLYDGHIWASTMEAHPLEPWEWWLGGMCLLSLTTLVTQELCSPPCDMADGHYIA